MAEQQTPTQRPLHETFLRQFDLAHEEVEKLRKLYPGCFDAQGRAIVASAHLPRAAITQSTKEKP